MLISEIISNKAKMWAIIQDIKLEVNKDIEIDFAYYVRHSHLVLSFDKIVSSQLRESEIKETLNNIRNFILILESEIQVVSKFNDNFSENDLHKIEHNLKIMKSTMTRLCERLQYELDHQ
jgi:hypothetical protein